MIDKVMDDWKAENQEDSQENTPQMPKPLIRLRVDYTGFTNLNVQRFGQQFVNKVANPKDVLHFHKRRANGFFF